MLSLKVMIIENKSYLTENRGPDLRPLSNFFDDPKPFRVNPRKNLIVV